MPPTYLKMQSDSRHLPSISIRARLKWNVARVRSLGRFTLAAVALAFVAPTLTNAQQESQVGTRADSLASVRAAFASPPADARPMMRWWWFGTAVEKPELARELRDMKAGGIGGAEIQPVYALELRRSGNGVPQLSVPFEGVPRSSGVYFADCARSGIAA